MKNNIILILFLLGLGDLNAQSKLDTLLPIRGFAIAAPSPKDVDSFTLFIKNELIPRQVNTLILRVDYNYQYTSHPELRDSVALSKAQAKQIVAACRAGKIRIIPQLNFLGHQSWANKTSSLLTVYPELDETPHIKMPEKYVWPNADSLYCKSYCPLHPKLHPIIFSLMDELCDVFETDAFHAGMDEVFYIGDAKCPRCKGQDKARLFADEVTRLRDHLAESKRELWIWGDRLIDGNATGFGGWEASFNHTYPAVDMIPKDVVICDWHYERADKTPVYFAMKGLRVVTCPWRNPGIANTQLNDMLGFRNTATPEMKPRFYGMMQTVWSGSSGFIRGFYEQKKDPAGGDNTPWSCFRSLYQEINKL
ncbi:MAG TPA: family 20 glycosylhydrolase [Chitinophagaceae bacterium]|nr:family 20 glycosylhydrolase [Chitinophagaceae bacterium]